MSRIIFRDTYTIVIPSFYEVDSHSHSMLHLFVSDEECQVVVGKVPVNGNGIFLRTDVEHILTKENACKLFLLFDPTSDYAIQIEELCLKGAPYCVKDFSIKADEISFLKCIENRADEEIIAFVEKTFLQDLTVVHDLNKHDDRMKQLVEDIRKGRYFDKSVLDIADDLYLSESRLQHLFKESMGISLKNYVRIRQIEYAYKLVVSGKSITYAALEAGFASPAHLAYTCKKNMGIAISNVLSK